jgi:hypothetical protein
MKGSKLADGQTTVSFKPQEIVVVGSKIHG